MKKLITLILLLILVNGLRAQYCSTGLHSINCTATDHISSVKILGTTLDNSGSGCGSQNATGYTRYAPSGSNTATLYRGQTYYISVTTPNSRIISFWIDYNHNDTFETTEWSQVATTSVAGNSTLKAFTIPDTALLDTTRLRVRSRAVGSPNAGPNACTLFGSGETEDYVITIDTLSACSTPIAGIAASSKDSLCGAIPFLLYLNNSGRSAGLTYQWQSSTNQTTWTSIASDTNFYELKIQTSSTYYRCLLTCGSSVDSTTNTLYVYNKPLYSCYCLSTAINSDSSDIGKISFAGKTNGIDTLPAFGNNTALKKFTDFTALSPASVYPGQTYTFSATQIDSGKFTSSRVLAYIDYNQDGVFNTTNERVFNKTTTGVQYGNTVSGLVTIPLNALPGNTYMRVTLSNGVATPGPCTAYARGETEDYSLFVLSRSGTDAGATALVSPVTNLNNCGAVDSQDVVVRIRNLGSDTLIFTQDTLQLYVTATNGKQTLNFQTTIDTGMLLSGAIANITVATGQVLEPGGWSFSAWTKVANDTITFNDTMAPATMMVIPYDTVTATKPYVANFESWAQGWVAKGTANSWVLGTPAKKTIIGAAGGNNSWMTGGLGVGNHNANERSWVESPCFDLSNMTSGKSEVAVDVWWNSQRNNDGAALQYSIDGGATWASIGLNGDPNNWYTSATMPNIAALRTFFNNNTNWWSGRGATGSGGWLTAVHDLPDSALTSFTKFRVAFGSDAATQDDGFAFDNFQIREKLTKDMAAYAVVEPINRACAYPNTPITVQIRNNGSDTLDLSIDSLNITIDVSGPVSTTYDTTLVSGKIDPSAFVNINLTNSFDMSTIGAYTFKFYIHVNGDQNLLNDTNTKVRNTANPLPLPYIEDFDTVATVPANYTVNNFVNTAASGVNATRGLRASMSTTINNARSSSPVIGPLTSLSALRFDYRFNKVIPLDDTLHVLASFDCGINFVNLYDFTNANTAVNPYSSFQLDLGANAGSNVLIQLHATNVSGTTWQINIDNMTVADKPNVFIGNDTSVCDPILLNANSAANPWDISWSTGAFLDTTTVFSSSAYWATATDQFTGLVNTDTINVTFYTPPTVSLGNDISQCPSTSGAMLDAGAWPSGYKYLWSTGDTTQTINVFTSGTYTATVITPGGCSGQDQIIVTFNTRPTGVSFIKGANHQGQFNNGTSANPDEVCSKSAVEYELTPPAGYSNAQFGTNWNLVGAATFVTATGHTPSANTTSITAPGAANGKIEFTPTSAEVDSTYILTITVQDIATGCDTTIVRYVHVNGLPSPNLGADVKVCVGGSATFNAGNYSSYLWSDGSTGSSITTTTTGIYAVVVADAKGCKASDSVSFGNHPQPAVNLGADQSVCPGNSAMFDAGKATSYLWSNNATTQKITVSAVGAYTVVITDSNGCTAKDTASLSLLPVPVATFTSSVASSTPTITVTATDQNLANYQWDFGDGNQGTGKTSSHTYLNKANYKVKLKVTNSSGCVDSSEQTINVATGIVNAENVIASASVFPNPNADAALLQYELIKSGRVSIEIYDVAGKKVSSVCNEQQARGQHQISLDQSLVNVQAGFYYIRLVSGTQTLNVPFIRMTR